MQEAIKLTLIVYDVTGKTLLDQEGYDQTDTCMKPEISKGKIVKNKNI